MKRLTTISILVFIAATCYSQNPSGIKNANVLVMGKFVNRKDSVVPFPGVPMRFLFFSIPIPSSSQLTHTIYTFQVDSVIKGDAVPNQLRIIGKFEVDSAHTYDTDTRMLLLGGPKTFFNDDPNLFYWFYTNSTNHQPKSKKTKIPIRRVDYYLEE